METEPFVFVTGEVDFSRAMNSSPPEPNSSADQLPGRYPNTQWSLVLAAGDEDERALNTLLKAYWFPVYGAFYDKVRNHHDAEDLTQRLFFELHRRRDFAKLNPTKGRFRAFLKAAVGNLHRNFVSERTAQKRGGERTPISIDEERARQWLESESAEDADPSTIFDRRWLFSVLEIAKRNLRHSLIEQGQVAQYEALEDFLLPQSRTVSYAEIATRLNQKEGTARVTAFRIRERFRDQIRACILETVSSAAEAQEEIDYLSALIGTDLAPTARQ